MMCTAPEQQSAHHNTQCSDCNRYCATERKLLQKALVVLLSAASYNALCYKARDLATPLPAAVVGVSCLRRDRDQMMWAYQSGRPTDPPSGLWYWDRGTGSISRFALPCALLMDWSAFGNYTNCGGDYMIKKVPDSAVFYQDAFWFIPSRQIYNNYPRCSLVKVPITYTAGIYT